MRRRTRTGRRAACSTTTAATASRTTRSAGVRFVAARNILKAWLLLFALCLALAAIGWALGGLRLLSIFVFSGLLLAGGAYWTFDRVVLGMVKAREIPIAEA